MVLRLVQQRRRSLHDKVEHRLAGLMPYGRRIMVRQLLNRTSGITRLREARNQLEERAAVSPRLGELRAVLVKELDLNVVVRVSGSVSRHPEPHRVIPGGDAKLVEDLAHVPFLMSRPKKGAFMAESTNPETATVVLVHGAFADASSWNGVIERLQAKRIKVTAPANPLRGISADAAYLRAVLAQIEGPVLAVGHSYGGAVITNAATDAENVVGLVYVAAFAPDEGETLGAAEAGSKDSVLNSALVPRTYPTADGGSATEFYIDPAKARDAFAGDLSDQQAALIAATQRPVADAAFGEPNGPPAWRHLPSWAVVATGDKAAGTDVVRSMAERAGAKITEVEGSHVIMVSQPDAVTNVILDAVAAVTAVPVGA